MDTTGVHRAVYIISVAAELAGVHPQTLRVYERKGLVEPARTGGGSRRYSQADVDQLIRIQELTSEGLNLTGVKKVLELEAQIEELQEELDKQKRYPVVVNQTIELYERDDNGGRS